MIGHSRSFEEMMEIVERVKDTDVPVLIQGESGTGKELIARAIHERGSRRAAPFIAVNCGAIPEHLLESELFGYAKGAFTGAVRSRMGLIEEADRGSFFLDEVAELPPSLQVKLLRVLQEKETRRVGENLIRRVDVRFISASNKDVDSEIEAGRFREDLYYRLKIIVIDIPPLRDRREEIVPLLDHFLSRYSKELGRVTPCFSERALNLLLNYSWPGNIRELQNEVQRCLILSKEDTVLTEEFLTERIIGRRRAQSSLYGFIQARAEFERLYIREALKRCNFHRNKTAQNLGLSRQGLFKLIKKHDIEIPENK
ncbi:MAG: sigma-54 dependent transcriptional regulator [Acidobacteria bacterium]|nr:sigma-54 dependent transcriptional regulator [Acidobacteriota bacterium]